MGVCGGGELWRGDVARGGRDVVGRRRACDTSPWRGCALCVESAALTQSSSHSRFVPVNTIVRAVVPPNTEITSASVPMRPDSDIGVRTARCSTVFAASDWPRPTTSTVTGSFWYSRAT